MSGSLVASSASTILVPAASPFLNGKTKNVFRCYQVSPVTAACIHPFSGYSMSLLQVIAAGASVMDRDTVMAHLGDKPQPLSDYLD